MNILIKKRLIELLALSVGSPTEASLNALFQEYDRRGDLQLFWFGEPLPICLIGIQEKADHVEILHLSVHKDHQGLGIGKEMMLKFLNSVNYSYVVAHTDDDAIEFYRQLGFAESSYIGSHGKRRYKVWKIV